METGLNEVMAMAEGQLFRFNVTGDRWAPPGGAMRACSVMERPMWYQIHIRRDEDGSQKACVSLSFRHGRENGPTWELWVGSDCRWESKVFGGGTLMESEWETDDAIERAVRTRNAAL